MKKMETLSNFQKAVSKSIHQPSNLEETMIVAILQEEAQKLSNCIYKRLKKYYLSHEPSEHYTRRFALLKSLIVTDVRSEMYNGEKYFFIEVTFDQKRMLSSSYWDDNSVSNPAVLISEGWAVKKNVWFKNIYRFGKFSGYDFIEQGIEDYNSISSKAVPIRITRFSPNNYQNGKTYR